MKTSEKNYLAVNKASWNNKVQFHLASDFYDMDGFHKGNTSLNSIELDLLGDIKGKSILHLQCHFGQDSISLARMGAKVTGIDLSDKAIQTAQTLNQELGTDARFICSDVYDLPNHLDEKFDIVFTSYGTIGWLPDMKKWSNIISQFLQPNGHFVFAEFHPVVWMFDDHFKQVDYSYFNDEVITYTESGTYADKEADLKQDYVMWNHSLADVLNNLLQSGLALESFEEFNYSPYNCFSETVETAPKQFRIKHLDKKLPMVYALKARKK